MGPRYKAFYIEIGKRGDCTCVGLLRVTNNVCNRHCQVVKIDCQIAYISPARVDSIAVPHMHLGLSWIVYVLQKIYW